MRRRRAAVRIQAKWRGSKQRKSYTRTRRAAIVIQKDARMRMQRKAFHDLVEKARVQATYKGQLEEARARLEREASEREGLLLEKQRLEKAVAEKSKAEEAMAQQERRAQAQEYAMLLKQQEQELQVGLSPHLA